MLDNVKALNFTRKPGHPGYRHSCRRHLGSSLPESLARFEAYDHMDVALDKPSMASLRSETVS